MKHTYRIRVQPQRYYGLLQGIPALTKDSLAQALEGVIVREIVHGEQGDSLIDVQLHRPSHVEAVNELLIAFENLGYSCLEGTVTEWTDNALAGLLVGGGGGGSAGFSTGDAGLGVMLTLLGGLVGAVVGSFIESVKVEYELQWNGINWQLVQVQPQPTQTTPFRPELAERVTPFRSPVGADQRRAASRAFRAGARTSSRRSSADSDGSWAIALPHSRRSAASAPTSSASLGGRSRRRSTLEELVRLVESMCARLTLCAGRRVLRTRAGSMSTRRPAADQVAQPLSCERG